MCDEYYRQIYRLHMQRIKEEEEEELEEDEEELLVCCCCVAALLGTHGAYIYYILAWVPTRAWEGGGKKNRKFFYQAETVPFSGENLSGCYCSSGTRHC